MSLYVLGDILVMDELGYFYFRDRTGDTFRYVFNFPYFTLCDNNGISVLGKWHLEETQVEPYYYVNYTSCVPQYFRGSWPESF